MSERDLGWEGDEADDEAGDGSGGGVETKGVRRARLLGVERLAGVRAAQAGAAADTGVAAAATEEEEEEARVEK